MKSLLVYPSMDRDLGKIPNIDKKSDYVPLGLLTVAAYLPKHWNVELIDGNLESVSEKKIISADLVLSGAMRAHRGTVLSLAQRCKKLSIPIVLGGPDVTTASELYQEADHLVLGEAEQIIEQFAEEFEAKKASKIYSSTSKVDLNETRLPRLDLLQINKYRPMYVEASRGCPFACDFCSIPNRMGRVPRVKSGARLVREFEWLLSHGYRGALHFVDDNLVGNKFLAKAFLKEIKKWQIQNGYPFSLYTMLTVNAAWDKELMMLLREAGFERVFIGVESPSVAVLKKINKVQNYQKDLIQSIKTFYEYGITVDAGMIFGNDNEPEELAENYIQFIEKTYVEPTAMSLLLAERGTPLFERLDKTKRLLWDPEKQSQKKWDFELGLNFVPQRDRGFILSEFRRAIKEIYMPKRYFNRVKNLIRSFDFQPLKSLKKTQEKDFWLSKYLRTFRLLFYLAREKPIVLWHFAKLAVWVTLFHPAAKRLLIQKTFFYLSNRKSTEERIEELTQALSNLKAQAYPAEFYLVQGHE